MKSQNPKLQTKIKLAVVGSRNITDFVILDRFGGGALRTMGFDWADVEEIVSGLAQGVDFLGVDLSLKYRIPYFGYVPEWEVDDNYNINAGKERNTLIVNHCDAAIVLWDGWSRGTADTLGKLSKAKKPYILLEVEFLFLDKRKKYTEPILGATHFGNVDKWDKLYEQKKAGAIPKRDSNVRLGRQR